MRQLTYASAGRVEWRDVPPPAIEDAGDALVRPLVVTRCDLDRLIVTGSAGMPGPFALGHETVGDVVSTGDGVRHFLPGDRVVIPFQISCGSCDRCRGGLTSLCQSVPYRSSYGMAPLSGVEFGGGLSDLLRVPFADHMLVPAPPLVDPVELAGAADNVTAAYCMVAEPLRRRPGAAVLVVAGAGSGMSLQLVQCAVALGSSEVVLICDDDEILRFAAALGANTVKALPHPDTPAVGSFPIAIDASGDAHGLAYAVRCTDFEGLCQRTYGDFAETTAVPLREMYARNITLKLGRVHARAHMPEVVGLIGRGRLHPAQAVTRRATFAEAAEAMLDPTPKIVFVREY